MANILKKVAGGLLERMLSTATVTAVRAWRPATLYEVDIHIPSVDLTQWHTIKRLKCRVGLLEYRDYTPARWDAVAQTGTLFIEAGHEGAGSRWVQQLQVGDKLLMGAAHAAPLPAHAGPVLCLGDSSALGHFLALQQLTNREHYPMDAAVYLQEDYEMPASSAMHPCGFDLLRRPAAKSTDVLEQWFLKKDLSLYTSIYIAGQISMLSGLRKKLKAMPQVQARIYAHGFWS
jgi:NADPH-dependent ferric siderophore reductase